VKASRVFLFVFLIMMSLCLADTQPVNPQSSGTIYIRSDGIVEGTDKIQRNGNVYIFTGNIYDSLVVERDNIVVDGRGYTLQGTGTDNGIDLSERKNVTVKNFEINQFETGIYIYDYSDPCSNTISGNIIKNNSYGIYIESSNNNTISGNNLTNNDYGIFVAAHFNVFRNNRMVDNEQNLIVHGGDPADLTQYMDTSNTVNGKPVYYWVEEKDKTVPSDAGYVALTRCTNITVQNLNLANNGQGILLASTTNSTIIRNNIKDNDAGIILWDSLNSTIFENVIANNGIGIRIDGIFPIYSQNNRIYGNNITNNGTGMYIWDSSNNTIYRNHIANNGCGIHIIGLGGEVANNLIHQNNFVNNTADVPGYWHMIVFEEVWVPPQRNVWDDGKEGNYWSDYVTRYPNATGTDGSGIWDTPYNISENNQDNYPLMNPVVIPEIPDTTPPTISIISPENKTYTVTEVPLIFTVSEVTFWMAYSLDGQANNLIAGNTTLTGLSDGMHTLTVYAKVIVYPPKDIFGNMGSDTIYFTIDTTSPIITILSPGNRTYDTTDIPLNFTATETTSWIGYSLDRQANVTITGNTTLTELSEGQHSLLIHAKDVAGNTGTSETIYFSIKTEPFPTLTVVAIVIVAVVGAALLVYFRKIKKPTEVEKIPEGVM